MQAAYWQCFSWIAQKRSGVAEPVLQTRPLTGGWPKPILEFLQGELNESDLVDDIKAEQDPQRQREILVEALFYTAERELAVHRRDSARRYFTAAVNLKVLNFIEHHMAVGELTKLNDSTSRHD